MRVLVTGASGFIGRAIALRIARDGVSVRGLVRDAADVTAMQVGGVEVARGDVCDRPSVESAVRGCTHVIHLAAKRGNAGLSAAELYDVNVRGTENVVAMAEAAGVVRLVYGSTLGVHGFVTDGILDERSPVRANTWYRHTKWLGEEVVRAAHVRTGLSAVVARISTVVGPGANNWRPLVHGIAEGRLRLIGDGTNHIDLVALDDLVEGLWLCATVPEVGGRTYVLGSAEPSTLGSFTASIARALGVAAPGGGPLAAPYRLMQRAAAFTFRTLKLHSNFAHDREVLVANKRASSALARAELGYSPQLSVNPAVQAMVAQFVASGRVPLTRTA